MKIIELKTKKIKLINEGKEVEIDFDYKQNLLVIVDELPQNEQGQRPFNLNEIEKRLKIKKLIIDASGSEILIEDQDHAYLSILVKDMKWNIIDQKIIDFVNDVTNAESYDVNKKD